ncbi:MAG: histidine kinase [Bdellovibrionales bacterium]
MSREAMDEFKPFLSLIILVGALFMVAFLKMEVRRLGYTVLKETKQHKVLKDQQRLRAMEFARVTRPDHIRRYAMSRLTLSEARNGQIIQLVGQRIAVPQ